MANKDIKVDDLLPLPDTIYYILWALVAKPLHGYDIMKKVEADVGTKILAGTLYKNISKMLDMEMIEETDAPAGVMSSDERRRYYKITGFGARVYAAEWERLRRLVILGERDNTKLFPESSLRKLIGGLS